MIDNKYIVIPIMTGTYKDATVTILNSTFQVKNEIGKKLPRS